MATQSMAAAPKYQCGTCGGMFEAEAGYNDSGTFICVICYQDRQLSSAAEASAARTPVRRTPAYQGIVDGAAVLQGYAGFLKAIAFLCFAGAVLLPILEVLSAASTASATVRPGSGGALAGATLFTVIVTVIGLGSTGVFYLILSRLVLMLAELALAHRDIARNSFS